MTFAPAQAFLKAALASAAVTAAAAFPAAGGALASDDRVFTRLNIPTLLEIMRDMGLDARPRRSGGVVEWRMDGDTAYVIFFNRGEDLQFYTAVSGSSATLEDVNEWNRKLSFSKSYIDRDSDPTLELDFDLKGGVSGEAVRAFLLRCLRTRLVWYYSVVLKESLPQDDGPVAPAPGLVTKAPPPASYAPGTGPGSEGPSASSRMPVRDGAPGVSGNSLTGRGLR
jgi:hypothetical protein